MALEPFTFTTDRGDAGVRLDLVLLRYTRGRLALSRRRLQAAIEAGQVSVNGVPVTKTAVRLAAGDRVEALLPAPRVAAPARPEAMPLNVLFEDEDLLAIDKPPGTVVHPSYKHAGGTLFNALLWHVGESIRPRLLNRLDKDTSGIVLVSKTKTAHATVIRAMRAGAIKKEYLAVVRGIPRPAAGTISLKLRRDPRDPRRVMASASEGKDSATRYETLAASASSRLALVRCELVTGRMHQIRVHLAARGWPIVGDRVYGGTWDSASLPAAASAKAGARFITGVPRHLLHAWRLTLPHPVTPSPLLIVAPMPRDMESVLREHGLEMP